MSEKRQQISLKEKKKFVLLIKQGANLDGINYTYRKKYGLDLTRSTYYKWKAECSKILDSTSKTKFREKKKQTQTMEDFEKKVMIEYQKRKTKLNVRGMSMFIKGVRDEFFQNCEILNSLRFSRCYILRLARDLAIRYADWAAQKFLAQRNNTLTELQVGERWKKKNRNGHKSCI